MIVDKRFDFKRFVRPKANSWHIVKLAIYTILIASFLIYMNVKSFSNQDSSQQIKEINHLKIETD
jgi:hypothetical protein